MFNTTIVLATRSAKPAASLAIALGLTVFLIGVVEEAFNRVGTAPAAGASFGRTAERLDVFDQTNPLDLIDFRMAVSLVLLFAIYGFFEIAWIRLFHAERTGAPITVSEAVRGAFARIGQLVAVHGALWVIAAGTGAAIIILAFEAPLSALLTVPIAVVLAAAAAPYVAAILAAVALTPSGQYVLPAARQAVAGKWEFGLRAVVIAVLPGSVVATALMPLDQVELPIIGPLLGSMAAAASAAIQAASLAAVYHALGGWAADVAPE